MAPLFRIIVLGLYFCISFSLAPSPNTKSCLRNISRRRISGDLLFHNSVFNPRIITLYEHREEWCTSGVICWQALGTSANNVPFTLISWCVLRNVHLENFLIANELQNFLILIIKPHYLNTKVDLMEFTWKRLRELWLRWKQIGIFSWEERERDGKIMKYIQTQ